MSFYLRVPNPDKSVTLTPAEPLLYLPPSLRDKHSLVELKIIHPLS